MKFTVITYTAETTQISRFPFSLMAFVSFATGDKKKKKKQSSLRLDVSLILFSVLILTPVDPEALKSNFLAVLTISFLAQHRACMTMNSYKRNFQLISFT